LKKRCLCLLLVLFILAVPVCAQSVPVCVDGQMLNVGSFLENGSTYVPLRATAAAFGQAVHWDSATGSARLGSSRFVCGSNVLNHTSYRNPVVLRDGMMYVPVRMLAAVLALDVDWIRSTQTVSLRRQSAAGSRDDALYWLSRIIYAEAGGEPMAGKIAVGNVVLARTESDQFPDTIYDVIFDRLYGVQFEPVLNGTIYQTPDADSIEAARRCLSGETAVENCLYFFNPAIAESRWIEENRTYVTTIGSHDFYA